MSQELVVKRAQSVAVPPTYHPTPPPRSTSLSGPASKSNSSEESHDSTTRRLGRKLPPALTESLLALERFETRTSEGSPRESQEGSMEYQYRRSSDDSCGCSSVQSSQTLTPPWNPPAEFLKYTLVVEPPTEDNCRPYEPGPNATKRKVARHQVKVEPRMIDTQRPLSLTFDSISVDDLSRPLSPGYSRNSPATSSSLFKSNWPSRRPLTPTAVPELAPPSLVSDSTASSSGWSALRELEAREREERLKPQVKETRKEKKLRLKTEKENFDSETPPGLRDLFNASLCEVLDEHGNKTQFGDLVTGKRTIVIFIRHWFCPLCAQYMNSILSDVPVSALEEADVDLVIIGNGSHKMLNGYKNKSFKCPFKMYTDPSLQLYRALGLTRQTGNAGPDSEAGSYLVQTPMEATMQTIKRATKMPLLHSPGHFTQIGGEFVFDGSLNVIYTHRMKTTRDHSPIEDVCAAAGLRLEYIHYEPGPLPPPVHRGSTDGINEWLVERNEALEEINRRKARRRNGGSGSTDEDLRELSEQIERLGISL